MKQTSGTIVTGSSCVMTSLSTVHDGIEWMTDRDAPIDRPVIGIGRFLA